MPILIGNISAGSYRPHEVKHVSHIRETKGLKNGDVIEFFGYVGRWDQDCVSEETCLIWRSMGDPLCDAALETIFHESSSSTGRDLLACLEEYVSRNSGPNAASIFLEEVYQHPPTGLEASENDMDMSKTFFLDHAVQIMVALLYYSLAGGFASARIVRTLHAVSYLVPPRSSTNLTDGQSISQVSNDRTYSRLLETFQFVLDVMGCTANSGSTSSTSRDHLLPGGEGWKSTVRVRMLHGVARRRAKGRLRKKEGDTADVPISQEDMSATLASFCIIPLWCLTRLGLSPEPAQAAAYLAAWRHVGFYLGVSPSILTRYFTNTSTADQFLASLILDLFSEDTQIDTQSIPTIPILKAVSGRPPSGSSLEYNCALTRYLVGSELATHLGVPETSLVMKFKLHATLFLHKIPVWFTRWYPRRAWARKRREVLSDGLARSVLWNLGMRRSAFRPRTDVFTISGSKDNHVEGSTYLGGELADSVKDAERVTPDPTGGQALVAKWRAVLVEMTAVCAGLGGLAVGATWVVLKWL